METLLEKPTHIGLGYATHPDPFQRGREAAQLAKNQIPDGPIHLVLVFGPGSSHFKDFVEGVRLVMGEETLVALPNQRVMTNETNMKDACYVVALQTPGIKLSIACDEIHDASGSQGTTALISHFRKTRGNTIRELTKRGCLVFSHHISEKNNHLDHNMAADMGLDSWLIGASTTSEKNIPFTCTNKNIARGLVAIEFLSNKPFGIGSVDIDSFMTQTDLVREALKTALRDAVGQMQGQPAAFGLVFFDADDKNAGLIPNDILAAMNGILPQVPLMGLSTGHHFVRRTNRSTPTANDSILVMLVPA